MGQYWKPVNLTKKEFIDPHKLNCGLKLGEQLGSHPGTAAALIILLAAMPEQRGGGDLSIETNDPEYSIIAKRTIGRWAGDQIALVGDYAEPDDLPGFDLSTIYGLCGESEDLQEYQGNSQNLFVDITEDVKKVLEYELETKIN